MKKLLTSLLLAVAMCVGFTACNKGTLQPGGAYAPTNSVGVATAAPDPVFYQVDAGFALAYSAIQGVLKFELDNRLYLWGLSPKIKKTLDSIRPDVVLAIQQYGLARDAYKASPTPAGLTGLQNILAKTQQLSNTAQAVIANLPTKGN